MVDLTSNLISDGYVRPNLADSVADHLRRIIAKPEFGDRLPGERIIADSLGVSRPVVREALSKLEADALIRRRRGYPTLVIPREAAVCETVA